eukprot:49849-Chlamydomonas_euryale.AAC.1
MKVVNGLVILDENQQSAVQGALYATCCKRRPSSHTRVCDGRATEMQQACDGRATEMQQACDGRATERCNRRVTGVQQRDATGV